MSSEVKVDFIPLEAKKDLLPLPPSFLPIYIPRTSILLKCLGETTAMTSSDTSSRCVGEGTGDGEKENPAESHEPELMGKSSPADPCPTGVTNPVLPRVSELLNELGRMIVHDGSEDDEAAHSSHTEEMENQPWDAKIGNHSALEDGEAEAVKKQIMTDVRANLAKNNLSDRGSDLVLKSRLALFESHTYKSPQRPADYQPLDYLIVVDFEATCEKDRSAGQYEQEIIEFPAVLVDMRQKQIVAEFHSYVRPINNKILSDFCTTLTGITQHQVNSAEEFPQVLKRFRKWLSEHGLLANTRWCMVTDGSFDIALFLYNSCKISRVSLPAYSKLFVHLPKFFQWIYLSEAESKRRANMREMLEHLDLPLEGRHHSGIDDARNLARICVQMLEDYVQFRPTDVVNAGAIDERRPYCARVLFVGRNKWRAVHKRVMQNV